MTAHGLTKKQADLLSFLKTFIAARGYTPSYAEMADGLGLKSTSGVHRLVKQLEQRGYVRNAPVRKRAIVVLEVKS